MDYQTGLWEKYLVTGDWSQSSFNTMPLVLFETDFTLWSMKVAIPGHSSVWCTKWESGPYAILRTANVQINVHFRQADLDFLCSSTYTNIHWFCKRTTRAVISLRECAGWSGPALPAKYVRALFVRCVSYYFSRITAYIFLDCCTPGINIHYCECCSYPEKML